MLFLSYLQLALAIGGTTKCHFHTKTISAPQFRKHPIRARQFNPSRCNGFNDGKRCSASSLNFGSGQFSFKASDNGPNAPINSFFTTSNVVSSLRGGAILPLLAPPSAKTTHLVAKLLTAYSLVTGIFLVAAPVSYSNSVLKGVFEDIEKDSFESSLLQSIGAIVAGFAIHVYLTVVKPLGGGAGQVSVSHAMAYSLLPRIFIILWSFLNKTKGEYQFQASSFLKINFAMMSWTAFSLLADLGNPSLSTKVFSTMAFLKAMALVTQPVAMTKKIFGIDVAGEEMAKAQFLSRSLGNYLAISAVLMMALAFNISPIAATGISSLLWLVLLLDMSFLSKAWDWIGKEEHMAKKLSHILVAIVISCTFVRGS